MKRSVCLFLTLIFVLCALPAGIAADEGAPEAVSSDVGSIDIALLLDVSGSMDTADPKQNGSRMSTDVAGMFSTWMPTLETRVRIKLIPYDDEIYEDFDPVYSNEKTGDGSGKTKLGEQLKKVIDNAIPGFTCYDGQTNIGGAMKCGKEFLASSDAQKKVMILFTDGKIVLSSSAKEQQSKKDAQESSKALKDMGADVFCVGLDISANGTNVDKTFLTNVSTSGSDGVLIAKDRTKLDDIFAQLTALIFPEDHVDATPEPSVTVGPDIPVTKKFWVYKDIVSETVFSLKCDVEIKQITVKDPFGNVIADMNYAESRYTCDASVCDISISYNGRSATVRLLKPGVEGDWEITMTAKKKGSVSLSKINYYDLELQDDLDVSEVFVGDSLKINAVVINKLTGEQVKSEKFFCDSESAAKTTLYVKNTYTQTLTPYTGVLNSSKSGYEFEINFSKPGTYELQISGSHEQFTPKPTEIKKVKVVAPEIEIGVSDSGTDDSKNVLVAMIDPLTGKKVTAVPDYLAGQNVSVIVSDGDDVVCEKTFKASELKNGEKTVNIGSFTPGSYTVKAQLIGYDINIISETEGFSVAAPQLEADIQKNSSGHEAKIMLVDPATGKTVAAVPSYMEGLEGVLTIMSADKKIAEYTFKVSEMQGGTKVIAIDTLTPGSYTAKVQIKGSGMDISDEVSFSVATPGLAAGLVKDPAGKGNHSITVTLTDPDTKQTLTDVPSYMEGLEGVLTVISGDKKLVEHAFRISELKDGVFTYAFTTTQPGDYKAYAVILGNGFELRTEEYGFTLEPSKISVGTGVENQIEYSGLTADYSNTVSIEDLFSDADGDKLTVTVDVDNENIVSAELDGTELKIVLKDFGNAVITIKATDGKGAFAEYEIRVDARSTMGILIAIIAAVLVILIAVIIFVVARKKSMIIQISFKIKVSKDDGGNVSEAVYKVNRLASNKYAKPTMNLATLLDGSTTFAEKESSSFAPGELEAIVGALGSVTVTGQAFKKSFDIALKGKRKATYKKSQVSIDVAELGCSLSFGSLSDFVSSDGSELGGYGDSNGFSGGFGDGGFDGGFSF